MVPSGKYKNKELILYKRLLLIYSASNNFSFICYFFLFKHTHNQCMVSINLLSFAQFIIYYNLLLLDNIDI